MTTSQALALAIQIAFPALVGVFGGHYMAKYHIAQRKLRRMTVATRMMLFAYEQGSTLNQPVSKLHIERLQDMQEGAAMCASALLEVYGDDETKDVPIRVLLERELKTF